MRLAYLLMFVALLICVIILAVASWQIMLISGNVAAAAPAALIGVTCAIAAAMFINLYFNDNK